MNYELGSGRGEKKAVFCLLNLES